MSKDKVLIKGDFSSAKNRGRAQSCPSQDSSSRDCSSQVCSSRDCSSPGTCQECNGLDYNRFHEYMSMTNDLVSFIDSKLIYRAVNHAYLRAFGLKEEDIVSLPVAKLVGEEYFEREIKERINRCLAGEQVNYDSWFDFPELGKRYIAVTYYPFKDNEGVTTGALVRARDLTDRKQALDELKRERDYSASILDTMGGLVVVLDEQGRVLRWNRACEECTGYSFGEVKNRKIWEFLLPPEDVNAVRSVFHSLTATAIPNRHENYWVKKSGERCYIEWSNNTVLAEDGEVEVVIGTGIDISERKRMEESLRESEDRYHMLFEHAADAVIVHDFDGEIIAANSCACALLGYEHEEILGSSMFDIVSHESKKDLKLFWNEEWDHFPFNENGKYKRKNGVEFSAELSCCCIEQRSSKTIMVIIRDITDKLRAEEERARLQANVLQTQKFESLGVLAGGIAHDFNNLLMVILGNADLALQDIGENSPIKESLEDIEHAARRAAELCRQMLAYSGKGRYVIKTIDLSKVVGETTQMMEVTLEKRADLHLHLDEELPPIEADVSQLRQLVMNLVTNAAEAIDSKGGQVRVTTGVKDCDRYYLKSFFIDEAPPPGKYVYLAVEDTGTGIGQDIITKIFDPFFSTKFTGRGLGLPAVLGIVRGHGGVIKVATKVGEGTTFTALFPIAGKGIEAETLITADKWQGEGTVLLVDDEERVRTIGARMLERLGFNVVVACDGLEALRLLDRNPDKFVLVLLDLTMPKLNGEDTYNEMRTRGLSIPVILSSGYNEHEVVQRFAGKGLAGFIQKPYRLKGIEKILREFFESKRLKL